MIDPDAADRAYLDRAARAALRAAGDVEPNPLVGALVVRDGRVLGMGHHRRFGGPHAEREAIDDARGRGFDVRGAALYVTLEPCAHTGKQPPCTDLILRSGVAEVVVARADPNPAAAGGASRLLAAGVAVRFTAASPAATRLTDAFCKRVTTGLPWVIAKWAQTIDGRIATRTGESRWISGPASRARVHRLRSRSDAILVGVGTALADDPELRARDVARVRRVARRVVVDPWVRLPVASRLAMTAREAPVIVACSADALTDGQAAARAMELERCGCLVLPIAPAAGVAAGPGADHKRPLDLAELLRVLASRFDATNVIAEGGAGLVGSLVDAGLADELLVYVAPLLLADPAAVPAARGSPRPTLRAAPRFELVRARRVGNDVELRYTRPAGA